ncbi:hypothetical protein JTL86_08335 [Pseudomonas aeruginosa]|nr:hypothetical protein [Pseudomonas aeruginosa]
MAQLIEHDKKILIARKLLVAPIVIPLAILALPFIGIALASKWIKESYRKSSLSPSPTEAQIQPEPPVQRPVGEKVIRKQSEQPMTFETAHSTYYSKVMQLIEKTLVELIDETTQGDMLIMHENVYARLSKLTPSVNWKNTITYADNGHSFHRALQFLSQQKMLSECEHFTQYQMERVLKFGINDSVIIAVSDKYTAFRFNRLVGDDQNETMNIFNPNYEKYKPYINHIKEILNKNNIYLEWHHAIESYLKGLEDGMIEDDDLKINLSRRMTKKVIAGTFCNASTILYHATHTGYDLTYLIPSLVHLIECPSAKYINEITVSSCPLLPWKIQKNHSVIRAVIAKNQFKHQDADDNLYEMLIETTTNIIHITPILRTQYRDKFYQIEPDCLKIYSKNNSDISAFGFDFESSSEGIDTMLMYCDESVMLIDSFNYIEKDLMRLIRHNPAWNDDISINFEDHWLKIQGKLINQWEPANRIED